MEKLEERIKVLLEEGKELDYGFDGENTVVTESLDVPYTAKEIASELKDIAIGFAEGWYSTSVPQSTEEQFNQFLEEKYK